MIQFNPKKKKRMTIKECSEPLANIKSYEEMMQYLKWLAELAMEDRIDYFLSMLSHRQQQHYYKNFYIEKNKNDKMREILEKNCTW
jgi:hypothetical protein